MRCVRVCLLFHVANSQFYEAKSKVLNPQHTRLSSKYLLIFFEWVPGGCVVHRALLLQSVFSYSLYIISRQSKY